MLYRQRSLEILPSVHNKGMISIIYRRPARDEACYGLRKTGLLRIFSDKSFVHIMLRISILWPIKVGISRNWLLLRGISYWKLKKKQCERRTIGARFRTRFFRNRFVENKDICSGQSTQGIRGLQVKYKFREIVILLSVCMDARSSWKWVVFNVPIISVLIYPC